MIRNNIKIAVRNILRDKFYSFINIFGLAIGITTCLLILLYVSHELSFDTFHKDYQRIFRVTTKAMLSETEVLNLGVASAPLAERFRNDIKEIESITRVQPTSGTVLHGDDVFQENNILYADSTFFNVFDFTVQQGNPQNMLVNPNSVVLSEETAIKYFGEHKVRGGTVLEEKLTINNESYQITGIVENVPANSHFNFDMLVSMSTNDDALNQIWISMNYFTYLKLHKGVQPEQLNETFRDIVLGQVVPQAVQFLNMSPVTVDDETKIDAFFKFSLQPITSIHLHSDLRGELGANSDISYIYIFSSVAIFIIIIACINFMNLATARGSKRAIEVGIRKTLGSMKYQLMRQFMIESILFSIIAMLLALGLTEALKYPFSMITGQVLTLNIFDQPWLLFVIIGLVLLVGLLAGSYPALYLTRFRPVEVLKGSSKSGKKTFLFRNSLVVLQFAISFGLIVCTTLVFKQMRFISEKNLGFDKENVIILQNGAQLGNRIHGLKNELLSHSEVLDVCFSRSIPSRLFNSTVCTPEGEAGLDVPIFTNSIDYSFIDTYKMEMASGRNFSRDFPSDSTAILINERAAAKFGWINEEPVGKYIEMMTNLQGERTNFYVVGVVKDFNFESFKSPISANVMFLGREEDIISIRVNPGNLQALTSDFETIWKKIAPDIPYEYAFLKENFEGLYQSEQKMSQIFSVFTSIAIFIACLGLLGLAAFTAEQRTKEIGIRKAMGASVPNVVKMLNLEFIKLVGIAILITSPVAWYLADVWLGDFIYKIEINFWPFVLAGSLSIFIAMATVGYQSFKAAIANPVDSLKTE